MPRAPVDEHLQHATSSTSAAALVEPVRDKGFAGEQGRAVVQGFDVL